MFDVYTTYKNGELGDGLCHCFDHMMLAIPGGYQATNIQR